MTELSVAGLKINKDVLDSIIIRAAHQVQGVAWVGGGEIARGLTGLFGLKDDPKVSGIDIDVVCDEALAVAVRLGVFFGYSFPEVAAEIRTAISDALAAYVGVSVTSVDVVIDGLVFPKG